MAPAVMAWPKGGIAHGAGELAIGRFEIGGFLGTQTKVRRQTDRRGRDENGRRDDPAPKANATRIGPGPLLQLLNLRLLFILVDKVFMIVLVERNNGRVSVHRDGIIIIVIVVVVTVYRVIVDFVIQLARENALVLFVIAAQESLFRHGSVSPRTR
eukprot:scaffold1815_cov208-Amphora_coffeaeformis.AAC.2